MVDPAFDFDLPENLGDRFKWGPINNNALKSIPVGYGVVDGDLVFLLKGGEEVNLGPLPEGVPGEPGAPGGSDAATAEWIETGPETTAALSAKIAEGIGVTDAAVLAAGDSLTQSDHGTVPDPWPQALGTELGVPVVNAGVGGQSSTDVAVRLGLIDPLLTLDGGVIPASGNVTVTALDPATSYRTNGTGSFGFWGYIETPDGTRVDGRLVHDMTGGTWRFERTTAGDAIPAGAGTFFHGTQGDDHLDAIWIFGVGRNNSPGSPGVTLDDVPRDADMLARHLPVGNRRILVWGPPNNASEPAGSAAHAAFVATNRILARRFGDDFIDMRTFLIERGLLLAGITPTGTDKANIGADIIPNSLRFDTVHLNPTGYAVMRQRFREAILERGWLVGGIPQDSDVAPVTALSSTGSSATTLTVAWTASADADAYRIEHRADGGAEWTLSGHTLGTNHTIVGLDPGTTYDVRVTAANVLYDAQPTTITATTTGSAPVVLASDSFDRAVTTNIIGQSTDSALGGSALTWDSTGIGIDADGRAYNANTTAARWATVDSASTDGRVRAVVDTLTDTSAITLFARYADASNYYSTIINSAGTVNIQKRVGGTTTTILPAINGAVSAGQTVALAAVGSSLTLYVDGVELGTVTDTSLTAGTKWGIQFPTGSSVGRLDDFVLTDA